MKNRKENLNQVFSMMADETLLYKLEADENKATFHLGVLTGLSTALHILYGMTTPEEVVETAIQTFESEMAKT